MTISVKRDGNVSSDIQTHDNSYSDVAIGLAAIRDEINRVFQERKQCPYYPRNHEEATRKIIRNTSTTSE